MNSPSLDQAEAAAVTMALLQHCTLRSRLGRVGHRFNNAARPNAICAVSPAEWLTAGDPSNPFLWAKSAFDEFSHARTCCACQVRQMLGFCSAAAPAHAAAMPTRAYIL